MAMEFANNGGANVIASDAAFLPPTPFSSISFWVKMVSLVPALQRFFGNATNWEVRVNSAGVVVTDVYNPSDGAASVSVLVAGAWAHVACNAEDNGVDSITDMHLNGVFQAVRTVPRSAVASIVQTIGNRTGMASAQGLNAVLDDFRVYNRKLSASEIQSIFAARGRDSIRQGLLSRVLFNGGAPGTSPVGVGSVKDHGPNGVHYGPSGAPVYAEKFVSGSRRRSA